MGIAMKTQPTGPFIGINNRLPDFALVTDKGRWLREAENVDITNAGNVVRRMAASLVQAMTSPHSLFETFLVRASSLYKITLPAYTETLVKLLASNEPMSYCKFNGDTYYSNGTDSGRIAANGTWYPWALPTPSAPACSDIGGALFDGNYLVAVSYLNNDTGEESGISARTSVASTGGIRVTLPAATSGATHINVYLSTTNGSVPFLYSSYVTGTATADLISAATGREANQRFEAPLPAGTRLFMHNGRLCSVNGSDLFYSVPYRPGYYVPAEGRIPFAGDISIAVSNQLGVYVAADKTYFLAGQDIGAVEIVRDVLPNGAVPGTEFHVPGKPVVGWFGENGIVLADTQGVVNEAMADAVDLTAPASGFSTVFQTRGFNRVVSCGWCLNLESMAATQYSGWSFTSSSNGYGTAAGGIYALEGTGSVDAHVSLGKENFGAENLKRMPTCYLGVSSDEPMVLQVTTPGGDSYEYEARNCDTSLVIQRVDVGKGLRENWFDLSIYNTNGSDFTLATVSFAPVTSGRRI